MESWEYKETAWKHLKLTTEDLLEQRVLLIGLFLNHWAVHKDHLQIASTLKLF